jgi:formate/nitrite transporter FocA (FNT family)
MTNETCITTSDQVIDIESCLSIPKAPEDGTKVEVGSSIEVPSASPTKKLLVHHISTKAPKDTLKALYMAGQYKASLTMNLLIVQCFMAGVYIAMAGHLYLAVGGGILGAALFPTGLIAVVLTSAELFTGDALVFVASVLGGQVSVQKLLRNWTVAWTMNFAGCLFWASVLAYASDSLEDLGQAELAVKVALKKANQPWLHIFLKGIGANFMVCLGIWQATCAEEVAGSELRWKDSYLTEYH